MNPEDVVRDFVLSELNFRGSKAQLTDDYGLLENEVIDSMGLFNLAGFLEKKFGIEVLDEDLIAENFGSIAGIANLVRSKLA